MPKPQSDSRDNGEDAIPKDGLSNDSNKGLLLLESLAKSRGITTDALLQDLIAKENARLSLCETQLAALSPKQHIVLEHLRTGLSAKEIGTLLHVREETIRTHILRIRARLGCPDLLSLRYQ